ncbi:MULTISPECIES: alpha/beta hydrolase [Cyanophyceae]|uniref:serine aminopeptidase domain-containing protein n=1 Tax=Cyanophyceae TaxID=3028117 RepID=UPI0016885985|nr:MULTISPECIES: alpha/beta hydrolase [Cyanophyceae]MBD1918794.1 alpha/beta hydrolase [Phormidium sp. FACHB-77]MBD2033363.1 alpha/beta hydrolase [Phormidium sp. FACHB-322]MBD2053704.1 alpha/beta hydrolase [Leptolyngbya sp. FACHB-60]
MPGDYILFAQHGWADTNQSMMSLAEQLAGDRAQIVAPCLNYAMTWLRISPLVDEVDALATATLARQPNLPVRIVGHSMGGLIWLEVLNHHPDWWPRIEFLTLVGSPVGGADLGRMLDPLKMGIGIAADLGRDRRPLAARLAAAIPTLSIAGDVDRGSDGTITIESTRVPNGQFVCLGGISHAALRCHPRVVAQIQQFWKGDSLSALLIPHPLVAQLRQIPGMTDAHLRDFARATLWHTFADGTSIRLWLSPLGIHHVFLASAEDDCLYSGYVGWLHSGELWHSLGALRADAKLSQGW